MACERKTKYWSWQCRDISAYVCSNFNGQTFFKCVISENYLTYNTIYKLRKIIIVSIVVSGTYVEHYKGNVHGYNCHLIIRRDNMTILM